MKNRIQRTLADRTGLFTRYIDSDDYLSVCLSVTLCIVSKRCILQQKSLKCSPSNTILQLSTAHTDPICSNSPPLERDVGAIWRTH